MNPVFGWSWAARNVNSAADTGPADKPANRAAAAQAKTHLEVLSMSFSPSHDYPGGTPPTWRLWCPKT